MPAVVEPGHAGSAPAHARANVLRWMLTVFDDHWVPTFTQDMAFATWQAETCPTSGRRHVHVYVRFVGKKRMSGVKNAFARQDMHCEVAQGTEEQCVAYVEKEETRLEAGARHGVYEANQGKQGRRSDLEAIAVKLQNGATLKTIALEHPGDFIRMANGIARMHEQVRPVPARERVVESSLFWGPTGTGKTHRVMHAFEGCYLVTQGRGPFDMYRGELCVFFDEFRWEDWTIQQMNRYLDKWRCPLSCRYTDKYAEWTHVVICANTDPLTWWPDQDLELVRSFRRRISGRVWHITSREQDIAETEPTVY